MQNNKPVVDWKTVKGERIRRQYFNFILVLILLVGFMVLFINTVFFVTGQQTMADLPGGITTLLKMALIWAALLALNIFCLGRTVCILTSNGLYCEHGFYKWERIQRMEFRLPGTSKSKITYAGVQLIGNDFDVALLHAPIYLMLRARKYSHNITIGLSKADIIGMLCVAMAVIAMSALIGITS